MANDKLYLAMKEAAKKRKIKASPQHDLYKRVDPYFYSVFYSTGFKKAPQGKISILLDISVKYCRYDELQWGITDPESDLRFTDKIRANSVAQCSASFPRLEQMFDFDGTDENLPQLCEDILDWLENYYSEFFAKTEQEYGSLAEFYLGNREQYPRLAGLACIERGDYKGAEECFRLPTMDSVNVKWTVEPQNDEQRQRLEASGAEKGGTSYRRSHRDAYLDYAIAMQNGIAWTKETAKYGLLPSER